MGWKDSVDLSKFIVAAATFGGPVGEMKIALNLKHIHNVFICSWFN